MKQVIVVRRDLNMRRGKEDAQASHASLAFLTRRLQKQYDYENPKIVYEEKIDPATGKTIKVPSAAATGRRGPRPIKDLFRPVEWEWMQGIFKKVVVQVNSLEELLQIYEQAKAAGLEAHLIEDSGLTEFHGEKTATCVGIGPDDEEKIDAITRHLPLR